MLFLLQYCQYMYLLCGLVLHRPTQIYNELLQTRQVDLPTHSNPRFTSPPKLKFKETKLFGKRQAKPEIPNFEPFRTHVQVLFIKTELYIGISKTQTLQKKIPNWVRVDHTVTLIWTSERTLNAPLASEAIIRVKTCFCCKNFSFFSLSTPPCFIIR